ncbi:DNA polymerase/3'-5' exonuclease PolX [Chitinophaga pendula]|uniref:DNA polymerase/3'-5' exonuclease PolX n=1 Tax=Chitinophaga TaxID=79328 RepID=UPI000BAF80C6|nr:MULTISPECIES: DNA polymerase/3'-5' exonuclease PolX [Chitinophaga]ASZ11700.1 histidinol-phosphatase [Chitinophaga sp. MD30]UCJ05284.1 DNA polymerase/3'-5' exonuclease PolX [Chitinophaga pendula]
MLDNYTIADNFSLLAKLMEIHSENSFKAKSFSSAAFTIEKLPVQLKDTARDDIFRIKGIGESTGKGILEMLDTGHFSLLENYLLKTPAGILEIMKIKGLGPKKIATIWKELEVESMGELLYACNENRLALLKGFGEKTQENVKQSINFYLSNRERFLYAEILPLAAQLEQSLQQLLQPAQVTLTGQIRRQDIIIDDIALVAAATPSTLQEKVASLTGLTLSTSNDESLTWQHEKGFKVKIYHATNNTFAQVLFNTSASGEFLQAVNELLPTADAVYTDEQAIFSAAGIDYIAPCLREDPNIITQAASHQLPQLITTADIKGIIHSHSQWSDGLYTLEEMALAAKEQGFEYLVISDHSRSAFYANGLSIERIIAQHAQIDSLNQQLAPFRIFKSIEADILNDGNLDYPDDVLASFDLVIASVHANLKMPQDKATSRLLKAIEHPHTTILGHMTGRLLLSRNGYPVDHKAIIDACVANQVVIELNAHPRRLDIDWSWIPYALEKGALISIDPDAHSISGYQDIHYGVLAAQKGGLTKERNLSSYSRDMLTDYLLKRKQSKGY